MARSLLLKFSHITLPAFFLFFALASCATDKGKKDLVVVDFAEGEEKQAITITNRVNTDYGPSPEEGVTSDQDEAQKPLVIALDLYPALYNSLGYVATFARLESAKVHVNIISSTGFSSVIAALYAKYENANMVEWKTFELYQILGAKKPFSEDWKSEIREFLVKEFGDAKLSQLKKLLIIPKPSGKKVIFDTNEEVVKAVMRSLDLGGSGSLLAGGSHDYLPALAQYGADQVWRISFLPRTIRLKHPDGYVFGIYSRLAGKSWKMKKQRGVFVYDEALLDEIDTFNNLSDAVYQTKDENEDFVENISQLLNPVSENSDRSTQEKTGKDSGNN